MASVQELLLANEAKKSPFINLLEGAASGFHTAQKSDLERTMNLIKIDQMRQEMAQQKQMQDEIAATMNKQTEQKFATVGGAPTPVLPVQKFKSKIMQNEKGQYSRTFETVEEDKSIQETKVYTPEQVDAIKSGDTGRLTKAFPTGVPKDAMTLAYSGERIANLESERNQQRDERVKNRYRNYVLDIEQRDPVIKRLQEQKIGMDQVDSMLDLIRGPNPNTVAASAIGVKMAKAMGEVGALTESDVTRYVQSGKLTQKIGDKLTRMIQGVPTDATIEEIQQIADVLKSQFQQNIQPRYDTFLEHYGKIEGIHPEKFAAEIGFRYGGGAKPIQPQGISIDENALDAELKKRGL